MAIQPLVPQRRRLPNSVVTPSVGSTFNARTSWMRYQNPETKDIFIFEPEKIRSLVVSGNALYFKLEGGVEFWIPCDPSILNELSVNLQIPLDFFKI